MKNDCGCAGAHGTCACDEPATCNPDLPGHIDGSSEAEAWIAKLEAKQEIESLTAAEQQLLADARTVSAALKGCVTPDSLLQRKIQEVRALARALGGPPGPKPMAYALLQGMASKKLKAEKPATKRLVISQGTIDRAHARALARDEAKIRGTLAAQEAAERREADWNAIIETYDLNLALAERELS